MKELPKLVAFTGKARCGKDAAGIHLITNHRFKLDKFAMPIYSGLASILDTTPTKIAQLKDKKVEMLGKTYRELLQTLGTEWGRELVDSNIWVKLLEERVSKSKRNIVVTDVRFDNEASAILRLGGIVVQLERPNQTNIVEDNHISEAGVSKEFISHTVINDGDISYLHDSLDSLFITL